jgi:hypothetical protein
LGDAEAANRRGLAGRLVSLRPVGRGDDLRARAEDDAGRLRVGAVARVALLTSRSPGISRVAWPKPCPPGRAPVAAVAAVGLACAAVAPVAAAASTPAVVMSVANAATPVL